MSSNNKLDKQLITATIVGLSLTKIAIVREHEPFYRRAAGYANTGQGGTIDKYYKAFKAINHSESDAIVLRKILLEIAYRSEFMKEELKQLRENSYKLCDEAERCLEECAI